MRALSSAIDNHGLLGIVITRIAMVVPRMRVVVRTVIRAVIVTPIIRTVIVLGRGGETADEKESENDGDDRKAEALE